MIKYILLFTVFFFTASHAQNIHINKGDIEFNVSSTFGQSEITADAGFGAFVADYHLVRLDLGYSDTQSLDRSFVGGSLIRFFETRTYAIPYLGFGLGYVALEDGTDDDASGVEISFLLGLRYYLEENVAINTELKTAYATEEAYLDGDEPTDADYIFRVGLSYLW